MDRKTVGFLFTAVFVFIFCFSVGKKTKSNFRSSEIAKIAAPKTPPQAHFPISSPTLLPEPLSPQIAPTTQTSVDVSKLKSAELYNALFEQKIFSHFTKETIPRITEHFTKDYSADFRSFKQQVTDRLGILKALEQQVSLRRAPSSVPVKELMTFYGSVLNNSKEHWLVKRQAFKNLNPGLTSDQREQYYSRLDNRILSLAAKSEAQILEGVLGANQ